MRKRNIRKFGILLYSLFLIFAVMALAGCGYVAVRSGGIQNHFSMLISAVLCCVAVALSAVCVTFLFLSFMQECKKCVTLEEEKQKLELMKEEALMAKNKAEHDNRAKSEFLNSMASQLRTPLSTILGMGEMLFDKELDEEAYDYTDNIYNAGKIMESLLRDLEDLSKIEKGELFIEEDAYSMAEVIRDTYKLIKEITERRSIEFQLEYDENIPSILVGDVERMKQVIINLLANAVSFTPIGRIIYRINYEQVDPGEVCIRVQIEDTGIGIKREDLEHAFSNLEIEKDPTQQALEGLGVGLTVTNRLLLQMGSRLQVESEYGQGSVFSFEISQKVEDSAPIGDRKAVLTTEKESELSNNRGFVAPNARILAVDDNRMNLAVINGILKKTRVIVDCVTSGKECLEAIAKEKYHAVLLDHMMPDMDGVTVLKRLRQMPEDFNNEVPVIVVTASAASGVRDFYLREGFDDYISKPIEVATLYDVLARHLPEELVMNPDSYEQQIATQVLSIQEDIAKDVAHEETTGETALEAEIGNDLEALAAALLEIKYAMTDFNIDLAKDKMKELKKKEALQGNDKLAKMIQAMQQEDYENVAVYLDTMLREAQEESL